MSYICQGFDTNLFRIPVNHQEKIWGEWVQTRGYLALRILHADTLTRLLSGSAHEAQTFLDNLWKPKKSATGAIQLVNNSNAPEALSIVTAIIKPTKEGKIEMEDWNPSFAPAINVSNRGTRLKRPNTIMIQITTGIM